MYIITGFGDEIDKDINVQLDVMSGENITALELRSVDGVNVLKLSDEQLRKTKDSLIDHGMHISAIGSPIGKIRVNDPFEPHLEEFKHAMDLADYFETPYIRIFSYYLPEGDNDRDKWGDEVKRRTEATVRLAEKRGITLLQENEYDVWMNAPERCTDLALHIGSPNMKLILDPANYVFCDVRPYDDAFEFTRDEVAYLHIKDVTHAEKRFVPAGEGDGQICDILAGFKDHAGDMYVSLEPHLALGGAKGGFSGADMFRKASDALKNCMNQVGAAYR